MERTLQMETDTAVEEREVLLQRAASALSSAHVADIRAVRDEFRDYREQYMGDPALALVDETLRKLDAALGEDSPDSYGYKENDPQ